MEVVKDPDVIETHSISPQGKRMIEFYSPTGPVFGRHNSNE